jgi:NhaP-type Na+/H+ or K+/H+ antiporter
MIIHPKLKGKLNFDALTPTINQFKILTAETSFLIRTFFFILFGFTIDLSTLLHSEVVAIGGIILLSLLFVRFLYFKFFIKSNIFPEILLMPRGLITILLFYSIPEKYTIPFFDKGILFLVIIGTSLLMMVGLMLTKSDLSTTEKLSEN